MFLRETPGLDFAGAAGARPFGRALVRREDLSPFERLRGHAAAIDWVPDLGAQIGSRDWWRGLFTCTALLGGAYLLMIDTAARTMASVEVPLGILTAVIGTPVFIVLLARTRGGWT